MAIQKVAMVGATVQGMTTGEHHGHQSPHSPCTLTGAISGGTSKLRSNGVFVSLAGHNVSEGDCCGSGTGKLGSVQHKLRVNGVSVQIIGDATIPHNGSATIITSNAKIRTV